MTSRNWFGKFALACATSSLLACSLAAQTGLAPPADAPAIALLDPADAAQWQEWAKALGWRVILPPAPPPAAVDARIQALAAAVDDAVNHAQVDPARVYVAGRGGTAAVVFYAISRMPDRWAAGLALGGSPQPAIDSNRIFTANFTQTPVLWVGAASDDAALAAKLKTAGLNLEFRAASAISIAAAFEWLGAHRRAAFPASVDCETNSPSFARCWWLQMTNFDAAERNDVLPLSVIPGSTGAMLDLGEFGFRTDDPGPGIVVVLPEKYAGPLKAGDRILSLDGKPLANAREYEDLMAKESDDRPAAIMVQRGASRTRIETRVVLPRRENLVTARVQAKYIADDREIQIVTRTATGLRVTVPEDWVPSSLIWNGLTLNQIKTPGCIVLAVQKEILKATRCP